MFHREGQTIILTTFFLVIAIILLSEFYVVNDWVRWGLQLASVVVLVLILQFFRNPKRGANNLFDEILAPVDGKVVVIEEVMETEYFNEKRMLNYLQKISTIIFFNTLAIIVLSMRNLFSAIYCYVVYTLSLKYLYLLWRNRGRLCIYW